MKISLVIPCYNEEKTVSLFYPEAVKVLKDIGYEYELIFINDGSKDQTAQEVRKLREIDEKHVVFIDLSRNFGKESAMYAGLEYASGDYITVMDVDLQDPPYLLKDMVQLIENENYDIVGTRRVSRAGEPKIRSFCARSFYRLINRFMDIEIVDGARDYRLMRKQVVESILELKEVQRFSKGIFAWVGYRTCYLEFENVERIAGETSWSFWKLFGYAIDGITAFTTAPLRLATLSGMMISLFSFVYMAFVFIKALFYGDPVSGYPSMVVIILFLGGIQLLGMGIIGEYLSKTYMEVKRRPIYFARSIEGPAEQGKS